MSIEQGLDKGSPRFCISGYKYYFLHFYLYPNFSSILFISLSIISASSVLI
ncbi:hypothetical protein GGP86_001431 [Salinibacter ruber]|nr:hypothetical protein [Salinibacter ruber]